MAVTISGTNGIAVPLGTAAAPAETNTTSSTTGIYYPTSTTLGLSTNGTNAVYIDASQNVGIGTSSPATKLHLYGATVTAFVERTGSDSAGYRGKTTLGDFTWGVGIASATNCWNVYDGTASAERMRIDSSGNLLVGTTTSGGKVFSYQNSASTNIGIDCGASMGANAALWTRVASTSTVLAYYLYNATNVGSITTNGTTTSYNVSSDYRLKEKVQPMTNALATVSALNPVTYDWVGTDKNGEGFIAHELQSVIPHAVTGAKDAVDDDGKPVYQGVDYSKIVVHLVAAIQELSAEVEALKAKVGA